MQRQKIKVGEGVCTHHRANVAVRRGFGGLSWFSGFGGWEMGRTPRGGAGEEGWFRAGSEGRDGGAGIHSAGSLHPRLCVTSARVGSLMLCYRGVWAAENFG